MHLHLDWEGCFNTRQLGPMPAGVLRLHLPLDGEEDHGPLVESFLRERGTTLAEVCGEFLDGLGELELDGTALRETFL